MCSISPRPTNSSAIRDDVDGAGAFRYGLYASKLGVGLDLQTGAGMKLRLDAYDPNRLTVDAKSYVKINDDGSLWVGADSLLRHTTPTLGVRLSR